MKTASSARAESHESGHGSCFFCGPAWAHISQLVGLSDRDVEILRCLLRGHNEGATAKSLGISACTVQTHLKRIHEKLGINSRVALVVRLFMAHRNWLREASSGRNPMCAWDGACNSACFFCEAAWEAIRQWLGLTEREAAIVQRLLADDGERRVASFLGISPRTVHMHLERTYKKLGVHSRVALVVRLFVAHRDWLREACPPSACWLNVGLCDSNSSR